MAKITILENYCKSCRLCISACPQGVIQIGSKINDKGYEVAEMKENAECIGCKMCAVMCPEAALEVYK